MKIKIQERDVVTILSLEGNIMQEDVTMMRNRLEDLMHNGKVKVVLDMNRVSYLSSMCLAVIIDVKNRLSVLHGDLKLAAVNQLIKNLFEMTRLIKFDFLAKLGIVSQVIFNFFKRMDHGRIISSAEIETDGAERLVREFFAEIHGDRSWK
jgi:anti-sigma B factor antagonist